MIGGPVNPSSAIAPIAWVGFRKPSEILFQVGAIFVGFVISHKPPLAVPTKIRPA